MPPTLLGPRNLLQYNPTYHILICRTCHYAIHPSAIPSHLLKHRIYRQERTHLLSQIAALDLLDPDQITLPPPTSAPIDGLPVIEGWRCGKEGCARLFASWKRMRGHWGVGHASSGGERLDVRKVMLQTFFRGTKIRYFEVAVSELNNVGSLISTRDGSGESGESGDEEIQDAEIVIPTPGSSPLAIFPPLKSSVVNFDMETLIYFHHFTNITSLTLPCPENSQPATNYWQKDFVLLALKERWLMCGLLAISACHLNFLTDNPTSKQAHCERSAQFFTEFSESLKNDSNIENEAKISAREINSILHCAKWANDESSSSHIPNLHTILKTLQTFAFGSNTDAEPDAAQPFTRANHILKSTTTPPHHPSTSPKTTPSSVLNRLRDLPSDMASVFGKPDRAEEFMATMAAIASLVECCEVSFASEDVSGVWKGMVMWVVKIGEGFTRMIEAESPAALVMVAFWAVLLVCRAEECGCWFVGGLGRKVLVRVREVLLLGGERGALSLIEDLAK